MDGSGVVFALLFSLLYPLAISLLVWRLKLSGEPLKPIIAAFLAAAVMFYVAYIRKVYALFLSGLFLYTVDLLATGLVEEAAKLLVLLIPTVKGRLNISSGTFYGLVAGFGFGAGEALLVLVSSALTVPAMASAVLLLHFIKSLIWVPEIIGLLDFAVSYYSFLLLLSTALAGPSVFSIPLLAVYERGVVVLLHGVLTGIVGLGLVKGETLKFYLTAVGLHIFVNFFAVLYALGVADVLVVEAALTVITVLSFLLLATLKGGRQALVG